MHLLLLVALVFFTGPALAQSVPPDFSYQGQLLDAGNVPLPGPVNLQVRIYDNAIPTGGEVALFIEDHTAVVLDNGVFSIRVGGAPPSWVRSTRASSRV